MRICTTCEIAYGNLVTISSLGVPHGRPNHESTYRWTCLYACPGCGTGLLVHFDHDCFAPPWEDPWDSSWTWQVDPGGIQRLQAALARCPDATQPSCGCAVHGSLRTSYGPSIPRGEALTIVLTDEGLPLLQPSSERRTGS